MKALQKNIGILQEATGKLTQNRLNNTQKMVSLSKSLRVEKKRREGLALGEETLASAVTEKRRLRVDISGVMPVKLSAVEKSLYKTRERGGNRDNKREILQRRFYTWQRQT